MSESTIAVTLSAVDRVTPQLVRLADVFRQLHAITERTAFLLRNTMRRKPQGPRPKHYPRRRRGR